jgi:hypothetical protein
VAIVPSNAEQVPKLPSAEHVSAQELVRRQGAKPITSVAEMARPELFESDQELDEFLAEVYAARRAGMA